MEEAGGGESERPCQRVEGAIRVCRHHCDSHPSRQSALGTAGSRLEGAWEKGEVRNREKTDYSESAKEVKMRRRQGCECQQGG